MSLSETVLQWYCLRVVGPSCRGVPLPLSNEGWSGDTLSSAGVDLMRFGAVLRLVCASGRWLCATRAGILWRAPHLFQRARRLAGAAEVARLIRKR